MSENGAKGWVRPIITLMFTGAFIYLTLIGIVSPDAFITLAAATIMFWFKSRDEDKS